MTKSLEDLDLSRLLPGETALLLDFDGTLVEFADHPDDVALAPKTKAVLYKLRGQLDGALAIITGRAISDIDRFFEPLLLPVAGVHGHTRRTAWGDLHTASVDSLVLESLHTRLRPLVDAKPGLLLERKPGSVALHFRKRPDCEALCMAAVHEAVSGLDGLQLLHGKMVIEAKAGRATKAEAVRDFMDEKPFCGRRPIFAGDDVTDEYAFGEIARRGGISIKIGPGATAAGYRTDGTAAIQAWLVRLAAAFTRQVRKKEQVES
jgi:trehalose 6-phosphate phosphatase